MLLNMCSRLLKNLINIVEMTVYSYSIKLKYYNYTNEFFEYLKGKEDKNDIYDLRFDNHTIFFHEGIVPNNNILPVLLL